MSTLSVLLDVFCCRMFVQLEQALYESMLTQPRQNSRSSLGEAEQVAPRYVTNLMRVARRVLEMTAMP